MLWHALRQASVRASVADYGRLVAERSDFGKESGIVKNQSEPDPMLSTFFS